MLEIFSKNLVEFIDGMPLTEMPKPLVKKKIDIIFFQQNFLIFFQRKNFHTFFFDLKSSETYAEKIILGKAHI